MTFKNHNDNKAAMPFCVIPTNPLIFCIYCSLNSHYSYL